MSPKHVLLTGPPGVGKTTLIQKTCLKLKEMKKECDGFFTEEIRSGRERIGFDVVTLSGKRGNLARVSDQSSRSFPKVGKYAVDILSFETLALPVFDCKAGSILVLDEIGKMELFSKQFSAKVKATFCRTDLSILATIPVARQAIPIVEELRNRNDCVVIEVSKENRNNLVNEVVDRLLGKIEA